MFDGQRNEPLPKLNVIAEFTKDNGWLKHFIIQQMHKYIIRTYNYNYYKIFKNI